MAAFLTTSGLQKFAVATPETPMTVKYMAIGTGTGTPRENMTTLFNEVHRVEIPNPLRDPDEPKNLEFTGYIPTSVGGWTVTELGLFDASGVLVAYDLLDESIVKSGPDSALKTEMYPTVVLALSNAADTQLIVSNSIKFDHASITNRNHANAHNIASITNLQTTLDQKTTDLNTVSSALSTAISTNKIAAETNLNNAVAAADLKDAQNVKITGAQTVAGVKTFSSPVVSDGANITAIPLSNVTGLTIFKNEYDSTKTIKAITANYTILPTDSGVLEINASSGNIVITMVKSSDHITKQLAITRVDSSPNLVTINPASGDSFSGEGFEYPFMLIKSFENYLLRSGNNRWLGVRSMSSVISKDEPSGGFYITHKGVAQGRVITSNEALGWGQTTQNVTASRALGATYKNTTGKPIMVSVCVTIQEEITATLTVAGQVVSQFYQAVDGATGFMHATHSWIVQNGEAYSASGGTLFSWKELR